MAAVLVDLPLGSPPRMRGKAYSLDPLNGVSGITPAYAGKSCIRPAGLLLAWDHPRVCGEKKKMNGAKDRRMGSPPRMRGKAVMDDAFIDFY